MMQEQKFMTVQDRIEEMGLWKKPEPHLISELSELLRTEKLKYRLASKEKVGLDTSIMYTLKKGKISSITGGRPDDLLMDNFGIMIALMINSAGNGAPQANFTDITNTPVTCGMWGLSTPNVAFFKQGGFFKMQVGIGTGAPARGDHNIGTPCVSAPESAAQQLAVIGGYSTPNVNYGVTIGPFGSTELITESVSLIGGSAQTGVAVTVCFARYKYLVPQSVTAGTDVILANTIGI